MKILRPSDHYGGGNSTARGTETDPMEPWSKHDWSKHDWSNHDWSKREAIVATVTLSWLIAACSGNDGLPTVPTMGGVSGSTKAGGAGPGGGNNNKGSTQLGTLAGGAAASTGGTGNGQGGTHIDSSGAGGNQPAGGAPTGGATSKPTGGTTATGGTTTSGGSKSTGGTTSTGGNRTAGGTNTAGGSTSTGGNRTVGGSTATGGTAPGGTTTGGTATGGSTATGGVTQIGGAKATGGTFATGGAVATGGSTSANTACASAVTGGTCPPKSCPTGASDCGCYTVAGLGARKKEILDAGGDVRFIASAMVETANLETDYAYGDNKTGDAFNAGCCKQNWYMIRQCHPAWTSMTASQYATSAAMNSDLALDIQVYNESRAKWDDAHWFAGHRNGQTGLQTGQAPNLDLFIAAYNWTVTNLKNGHMCDDVRFWATVPAIVVN